MKKILKNRILIVNDDPVQLRILAKYLEKGGKEVITCAGGEEALRKLREIESVDLIITDLYMPGIDGWKLCRLLRSSEFSDFNKIPILVMSATFSGSDAEDITRELGANGFISVPYNPEILRSTIENVLLGKAEQRELRVLVVEDSESLRGTICEGLREYGYSVFEASNGNQAYSLFEEVNPEVVILDYHLPEHDGAELLAAFKLPQSQAAVLVATGDASPELAMKVTKMGADAFVRKPFKIGYLIDLCEKIRREWSLLRVEKLLEDRTLELRRILETSVDGIVITDTSGCIVQINSAVKKMLECSKDEIVGKHIWELMPQNEKGYKKAMRMITDLKGKEKMVGVEQVWKRRDGNLFQVELNLSLLKDVASNIKGAVVSVRDITERKKVEESIEQRNRELSAINAFATASMQSLDLETVLNKDLSIMLELTNFQIGAIYILEGKNGYMVLKSYQGMNPDNIPWGRMVETKELTKYEDSPWLTGEIQALEDASHHPVLGQLVKKEGLKGLASIPIKSKDKTMGIINIAGRDPHPFTSAEVKVLDSLAAQISLSIENAILFRQNKESKESYQALVDNVHDIIFTINADGKFSFVSAQCQYILGYTPEELMGSSFEHNIHPDDVYKNTKAVEDLFGGKKVEELEYRIRHKNGSWRWHIALISALKDEKGNIISLLGVSRDISERKEMEDKLLQSEKLRSLGELAGGVAHNFNNILAVILGRAQLLGRSVETLLGKQERRKSIDDLKKSLGIIEKAAFDGVDTVRSIQEFSRERNDDKNFTGVDLNEVIEHTLEFTEVRWKDEAGPKGIKINIQKELSHISPIAGSGSELREVFINLINNALDAMPQGGKIRLKTFMENSHVVVLVEDTGIGIPKDIRDKIFDPFFTTKGVQSTGLGMSASYGIINRHRGTITVDSVEGQGTTFSIKFPKLKKVIKEKEKLIVNEQNGTSILVVEDEECVRALLKDILMDGGYKVEVAPNGKKGIKLFQEKKFNLVLTDLGMPGMSGWQVAEEIKKMNGKTKVALVTGWEVDLSNSELRKCGVDLVINKPFQMNQILGSVREMMEDSTPIA